MVVPPAEPELALVPVVLAPPLALLTALELLEQLVLMVLLMALLPETLPPADVPVPLLLVLPLLVLLALDKALAEEAKLELPEADDMLDEDMQVLEPAGEPRLPPELAMET